MTILMNLSRHALCTIAMFVLCFTSLFVVRVGAQTVNASLGGIVSDPTGARLPGVSLTLKNQSSGDTRQTKTNRQGVFQFNAVPTGTYSVTARQTGFSTLTETGVELHPNDVRNLEIGLRVGQVTADVTVDATDDVPTSGERSTIITASDIKKLSTVGRDVSELLKTQAGFSILQGGLDNGGGSDPSVVGTAGSGLSNYVGGGATGNGTTITSDGANVTDPVTGNSQTQAVNMDMVSEVKIETSNFGADTAHGPTVITAVGKSGGSSYHGSVYAYGRTAKLNAEDWYSKFVGLPPIQDHYVYPGFNLGGPFAIPGTNINHNKKVTFFIGAEDYIQRNVYAYGSPLKSFIQALVPTDQSTNPSGELGMRQGNFTQQELANFVGYSPTYVQAQCTASGALVSYIHVCAPPNAGAATPGTPGQIATSAFDPGAAALLKEFPLPTGPTVNGYNWSALNLTNPDLYQFRTRWDYAMNDMNKFYAVFNTQQGQTTGIPEQINYSPSQGQIMGGLDTPGKIMSTVGSNTASANYTHIFSARATNEVFAALSQVNTQYKANDPSSLLKSTIGYPYHGLFTRGSCAKCGSDDFPQLGTYSSTNHYGLPLAITPDFSNGPYITKSFLPSVGDNFSYLIKSHTVKIGVYLERDSANSTLAGPLTNGQISQYYVGTQAFTDAACVGGAKCHTPDAGGAFPGSSQNFLADFLLGDINTFTQENFNPNTDLYFWTVSWFATDSWKVSKKLTLDYGVRFDHLGSWKDNHGLGLATFSPTLYASDGYNANLPGIRWHGGTGPNTDPNTPLSGSPTRFAFVSPRFGLAYDVYGDGKTLVRGGFGLFRGHDSYNDYAPPAATAQGALSVAVSGSATAGAISLAGVDAGAAAALATVSGGPTANATTVSALDPTDSQQPLTYTYSFSVTQQLPENLSFNIGYVGNQSHDLLTDTGTATQQANIQNINAIPLGGLFVPDPNPLSPTFGQVFQNDQQSAAQMDDYRKYPAYSGLYVPRHVVYANYNAMQVSLNKQKGRFNLGTNYTWSRANGVRGGYNNGAAQNPTDLRANYGPLAFDRTNIFNASYSYDEGDRFHVNRFVNVLANGWFISGITNLQSGPNLQAVYSPSLAVGGSTTTSANGAFCYGGGACNLDNRTVLGSPDIYLSPTLRSADGCSSGNPTANLQKHQYINAYCFGIPSPGENGPSNLGYLHGPAFESSDLSVQRRFNFQERRNIEIRASAFNFLNHPITAFNSHAVNEASLLMGGNDFASAHAINTQNTNPNGAGNCSAAGSTCFGYAGYKTGRRVIEISARYNF